jgi:hypothetical protein
MGIDLNGLVPNLVNIGYDLAADIVVPGTYTQTVSTAYDPATGALGATTAADVVDIIRSPFRSREIDGTIVKTGDERFVIRSSEFVNVSVPSLDDRISVGSDVWEVMKTSRDPTGSVFQMHVRRSNL